VLGPGGTISTPPGEPPAVFFLPRVPIGLQRAILRALDRLGQRLPGARG
jgi:hypothetical protein